MKNLFNAFMFITGLVAGGCAVIASDKQTMNDFLRHGNQTAERCSSCWEPR
jgi:hypothetical protein